MRRSIWLFRQLLEEFEREWDSGHKSGYDEGFKAGQQDMLDQVKERMRVSKLKKWAEKQ